MDLHDVEALHAARDERESDGFLGWFAVLMAGVCLLIAGSLWVSGL